jgi:hypothetical protein
MRTAAAIAVSLVAAPAILAVAVLALDSLLPARVELPGRPLRLIGGGLHRVCRLPVAPAPRCYSVS